MMSSAREAYLFCSLRDTGDHFASLKVLSAPSVCDSPGLADDEPLQLE